MPTKAIETVTLADIWFEIKDPLKAIENETWEGEGCPYGEDVDGIYKIKAIKQFSSSDKEIRLLALLRDPIDDKHWFIQHKNYYVETQAYRQEDKYAPGYGPIENIKDAPIKIDSTCEKHFTFCIEKSFLQNINLKDNESLVIGFDLKIDHELIHWEYKMREYYTENFLMHVRRLDRRIDELEEKLKQK